MPGELPDYAQHIHDLNVTVASISTIPLTKLNSEDPASTVTLQASASQVGFFYLDLRNDPCGSKILADLPALYELSDLYFSQREESKMKDVRNDIEPSQDLGYKASSCDETFEVSWDEMSKTGTSHLPKVLRDQGDMVHRFSIACQEASLAMLKCLSSPLAVHHRAGQPSETGLKFISEPALPKVSDVGDWTHTDGGTLTMLFYEDWGLQTYLPASKQWAFIPPQVGCVVVNVANSLQRMSGQFHSPKHRITQVKDGAAKRYYLSYFLRPELAVKNAGAV